MGDVKNSEQNQSRLVNDQVGDSGGEKVEDRRLDLSKGEVKVSDGKKAEDEEKRIEEVVLKTPPRMEEKEVEDKRRDVSSGRDKVLGDEGGTDSEVEVNSENSGLELLSEQGGKKIDKVELEEPRGVLAEKEAEASSSSEIKLSKEDQEISAALNPQSSLKDLQKSLCGIEPVFAMGLSLEKQKEIHEASKVRFQKILESCPEFRSSVVYARPGDLANTRFPKRELTFTSPGRFVVYEIENQIDEQILECSEDKKNIHIFSLSTHYNAGESQRGYIVDGSSQPLWPGLGEANEICQYDNSQGALGQKVNKKLFELTNAYLTNGGFNMLTHVLDESTHKYMRDGHLLLAEEGYIEMPADLPAVQKEELDSLDDKDFWETHLSEMKDLAEHFSKELWSGLELPCLETVPDGGQNPVHLILSAAPALGAIKPYATLLKIRRAQIRSDKSQPDNLFSEEMKAKVDQRWEQSKFLREELSLWAAFASFMAQFEHTLSVAGKNPDKGVVLHLTGTGLGRGKNHPNSVATGLIFAAHAFDAKLRKENIGNVTVVFSRLASGCDDATRICAKTLLEAKGLDQKSLFTKIQTRA